MTVYSNTIEMKDTAANFTSYNPTLAKGKIGHETDTGKIKIGDGATAWTSLGYTNIEGQSIDAYLPAGIERFAGADGKIHLSDAAGNIEGIAIGAVSSSTGSAFVVSASSDKAVSFNTEDGSVAITTGNFVRTMEARILLSGANTTSDVSAFGAEAHVKLVSNFGSIGHKAGVWGYFEAANAAAAVVPNLSSGVLAMLDVPASASIAAGCASAIAIASQTLAGTHTGLAACINVENPLAGTWDVFANFGNATGATTVNTAKVATGGDACIAVINVKINGVAGYVPVLSIVPHV
jgi:hypothetical protein